MPKITMSEAASPRRGAAFLMYEGEQHVVPSN